MQSSVSVSSAGEKHRWRTFLPFAASSLVSSGVDLGAFWLLCCALRAHLPEAVYITAATIAARVLSRLINYLINYFFVFQSHAAHQRSAALYTLLTVLKTLASAALVSLVVTLLPGVPEIEAKIPVDVALFVANYLLQNAFVY